MTPSDPNPELNRIQRIADISQFSGFGELVEHVAHKVTGPALSRLRQAVRTDQDIDEIAVRAIAWVQSDDMLRELRHLPQEMAEALEAEKAAGDPNGTE